MKKSGIGGVLLLALILITGLSILYWRDVGERLMTASASVNGTEYPIYSVECRDPRIALSFQVKGSNENLRKIEKVLEKNQVKATFFVDGAWAKAYPEDVRNLIEGGHDLGSSGKEYREMTALSQRACRNQIRQLHESIREKFGYEMELFSLPYGRYDNRVIQSIYACGYYPVCWSVDTMDWKNYGKQDIISRVTEHEDLKNGAIIRWNTNGKYTVEALEQVLKILREKGYEVVPVSRLIYRENFYMDSSGRQFAKE